MPPTDLEQTLLNLDESATLLRDGTDRQLWRFESNGRPFYLHFSPRKQAVRRLAGASSALRHFVNLQTLQRLQIPAPRAAAHLAGFRIKQTVGDAVIVESLDGAVPLDELFLGPSVPHRHDIARQVIQIVDGLGRAKLGHSGLGLDCFLVQKGKVFLHDVRGMHGGGLSMRDILTLWHNVQHVASRSELLRAWNTFQPDQMPPRKNSLSPRLWKRFARRTTRENAHFGRLAVGEWSGTFTKWADSTVPSSLASKLGVEAADWQTAWPRLLAQLESGQLTCVKSDPSGDIHGADVVLAGRPISVVLKRPGRKFLYRYFTDAFRISRAKRMWLNAWSLLGRHLPCEWPMLIMERRVLGYVADAIVVFERVPGPSLDRFDLNSLSQDARQMLFRRAGRTLRRIEDTGLAHGDAKSTNWIVFDHPVAGPTPVMIDLYGIRPLNFFLQTTGIQRLLRAMKQHPQYTPADSLALCQGFAPFAQHVTESE